MRHAAAFAALPLLAGCAGEMAEAPRFTSAQEEACYRRAAAALTGPGQTLERAGENRFVVVTKVDNFVRDVDPSPVFDACMAAPPAGRGALRPVTLSASELVLWDTLGDAEKRAALEFVRDGGTFAGWVAQR